jgi:integrase
MNRPPSQVKALLNAASGSRPEAFCVVAIHTGLRRGELLGLRSASADLGRARGRFGSLST